jgi:hypothetical protein
MFSLVDGQVVNIYSNWSPRDLLGKKYRIEDVECGSLDVELDRMTIHK